MLSHNGGEPVSLGMAEGLVYVGDDGMVLFSSDSETYRDSNGDYQRTFRLWVYDGGKATVLEKRAYS